MLITRTSIMTGITHAKEIPVTPHQLSNWLAGQLIQRAMPNISADDREFLITGITPEEFAQAFPEEPEDDREPQLDYPQ